MSKDFNNLGKMAAAVLKAEQAGLKAAGIFVKGEAKVRAPVKDGNLKASIDDELHPGYVLVGTPVDYAPHVEFGTPPHTITIKNAKVLTDGKVFFGKKVNHPGTSPQPYLRPALDENISKVNRIITETTKQALERAGRG